MTISATEKVERGVKIVYDNYAAADARFLQLKANCEMELRRGMDLLTLFLRLEDQLDATGDMLNQIEANLKTKVSMGTDLMKVTEEIERIEVCCPRVCTVLYSMNRRRWKFSQGGMV